MTVEVLYLRHVARKQGRHMRAVFTVRLHETLNVELTLQGLYLMGDDEQGWWLGSPGRKSGASFEPYIKFSPALKEAIVEAALERFRQCR